MAKYVLLGIYEYTSEETEEGAVLGEHRVSLATFDDLEDAEEYVEASKTSEYQEYNQNYQGGHNQFKEKSILHGCVHAEIEEYEELPHNPVLR